MIYEVNYIYVLSTLASLQVYLLRAMVHSESNDTYSLLVHHMYRNHAYDSIILLVRPLCSFLFLHVPCSIIIAFVATEILGGRSYQGHPENVLKTA